MSLTESEGLSDYEYLRKSECRVRTPCTRVPESASVGAGKQKACGHTSPTCLLERDCLRALKYGSDARRRNISREQCHVRQTSVSLHGQLFPFCLQCRPATCPLLPSHIRSRKVSCRPTRRKITTQQTPSSAQSSNMDAWQQCAHRLHAAARFWQKWPKRSCRPQVLRLLSVPYSPPE